MKRVPRKLPNDIAAYQQELQDRVMEPEKYGSRHHYKYHDKSQHPRYMPLPEANSGESISVLEGIKLA